MIDDLVLDEDIVFEQKREAPTNITLELMSLAGGILLPIGGAVGGYFGVKNGIDSNYFGEAAIGAVSGLAAGAGLQVGIWNRINSYRNNKHEKQQLELDLEAMKKGTEQVRFSYRGNNLDFIIREEHDKGNIFYMSINDGIVQNPTFSYQPSMQNSLRFVFNTPIFKNKTLDFIDEIVVRMDIRTDEDLEEARDRKMYGEEDEFKASVGRIIAGYRSSLDENEILFPRFRESREGMNFILSYSGERIDSRKQIFADCASEIMDKTYESSLDIDI